MNLFIITGGSKGLGEQICRQALDRGHSVLNLSRSRPQLKSPAFKHLTLDFSLGLKSIQKFQNYFKKLDLSKYKKIYLINNAALINPVGSLQHLDLQDMNTHLLTNFVSPVLLSKVVASEVGNKKNLTIFNIGSGAAFKPIPGWSMYCSTKAALKMFTENTDLDLSIARNKKIKIFHFSPGVLDTQMQQQIRGMKKKDFPQVEDFKKLKQEQKLRAPTDVAKMIIDFCLDPGKFKTSSPNISVNDLEQGA